MANHSSILAWEIPWTEKPGGLLVHGVTKESDTTEGLSLSITLPTVPPSILHQTARETIFKKYKSESVVL